MDDLEKTLWATIDIKGYGAYVMTASMGLEDIKSKVHKRKKVADDWSLIVSAYEPISKAAEAIDLNALDDRFPADVVREVKCLLIPELNQSYNTLNSLLTEYRPGKSKNVNSIILSLTKPNCIIQLFHKNNQEIKDTISNLRDVLKNSEIEINLLLINQEEGEINTFPFL